MRFTTPLLAILILAACNQKDWFNKFIPKEPEQFSKQYIELLQARDFTAIEARIDPSVKTDDLRPKLEQMASFFPSGKPIAIQAVGANSFITPEAETHNLTFQYEYQDKWLLANVASRRTKNGETTVVGFNVYPLKDSLETINRFTFSGKGLKHYGALLATIVVPTFILGTLVVCVRTPIPKRKWLWMLIVLSGLGQVAFNWTDGAMQFNPLTIQVFGCGAMKMGLYAPWMLTFTLPIGAFVFLIKRKKLLEQPIAG